RKLKGQLYSQLMQEAKKEAYKAYHKQDKEELMNYAKDIGLGIAKSFGTHQGKTFIKLAIFLFIIIAVPAILFIDLAPISYLIFLLPIYTLYVYYSKGTKYAIKNAEKYDIQTRILRWLWKKLIGFQVEMTKTDEDVLAEKYVNALRKSNFTMNNDIGNISKEIDSLPQEKKNIVFSKIDNLLTKEDKQKFDAMTKKLEEELQRYNKI
ncbi:MAG: hypothetical protein QXO65_03735, partial [Candidatus Aenigmatarchaeota archaeon]